MTRIETVVIIHQPPKILLGLKNPAKKFGGKWNGFGGGVEEGETIEQCGINETFEETGIRVRNLKNRGIILFGFESGEQNHEVHFLETSEYEGELKIGKDFTEYKWFDYDELQNIYNQMMPADKFWMPLFIRRKLFRGNVTFDKNFQNPKVNIYEVNALE